MKKKGLESHLILGNQRYAEQGFHSFSHKDELKWNHLVIGYIRSGKLHHGIALYDQLYKDNIAIQPSEHTFVALLKTCAKLKDREQGIQLHDHIVRIGLLKRSLFLGNALVYMYSKCGLLENAQLVCNMIPFKDVISLTTLISGYAEHGRGKDALGCFRRMFLEGMFPNLITFICSLKACGSIGAIRKGLEIHAGIEELKLPEQDIAASTSLIDMYAKCGSLEKAKEVLYRLGNRDVVAWNALIVGYTEHGHHEEVLKHLEQMQLEGVSPDSVTLVSTLRACLRMGAFVKGQEIQAEIERNGFLESKTGIGNVVVDIYVKHGLLAEAKRVFNKLPVRDVLAWNMLITGYVEHRQEEKALECFEEMQFQGLHPSAITYVCCLKACGILQAIDKGREIHGEVERQCLPERNMVVGNALVDMYIKCGLREKAHCVFDNLQTRDVVTWTSLISGYADHGKPEQAINLFEHMIHENVMPNAITFLSILKACSVIGDPKQCDYIHSKIEKHGLFEKDHVLGTMLVDAYAKCGSFSKARDVFEKIPVQDVVLWNTMISGYVQQEHHEEALKCFDQMHVRGISPNAATFVSITKACCSIGSTNKMAEIHAEIERLGLLEKCTVVGSSLVDMYSKSGNLTKAEHVFHKLSIQDRVSWTILMGGYAQLGQIENVLLIFERMLGEGIKPDPVAFLVVLDTCTRAGLVNKGYSYYEAMSKDYGIVPTLEHHVCMVNLFGSLGQLQKALTMSKETSASHSPAVWRTVLNACRNWGNVELGKQAFNHAMHLEKKDAVSYVFMSLIYASCYDIGANG